MEIIYNFIVRLLVFGLVWIGIYHIYTTVIDTGYVWWSDAILSGLAALNMFFNKGLCEWFINVNKTK
jgi:hypothetical protein